VVFVEVELAVFVEVEVDLVVP
jgi:hypothetical protein